MDAFAGSPAAIIALCIFIFLCTFSQFETLGAEGTTNPLYIYGNAKNMKQRGSASASYAFLLLSLIGGFYSLLKHAQIV